MVLQLVEISLFLCLDCPLVVEKLLEHFDRGLSFKLKLHNLLGLDVLLFEILLAIFLREIDQWGTPHFPDDVKVNF